MTRARAHWSWLLPIAAAGLQLAIAAAPPVVLAQGGGTGQPQVRLAPRVVIEVDVETPLIVQVGPAETIPANSYVQLRGLPESATLNEGHSISAGIWAVPLRSLSMLSILAPQTAAGTSEFTVRLVDVEGRVLTEAKSAMTVAAGYVIGQRAGAATEPVPRSVPPAVMLVQPTSPPATAPSQLSQVLATPSASPPSPVSPPVATVRPAPVPVPQPPPAAAQDKLPPEERARLEKMVSLGSKHLASGNIAAAREFFRRAADGGLADGALLLATTFDPVELNAIQVQGLSPDPAEARRWYERARSLGAAGVDAKLARLAGK